MLSLVSLSLLKWQLHVQQLVPLFPVGYAVGSVEGRVAIQYINAANPKDNFTFKCQRINGANNSYQEIYAVSIMLSFGEKFE